MKIRNIIWDLNGTLFDTYPSKTFAFQRALKDYGVTAEYDEIMFHIKKSTQDAIDFYQSKNKNIDEYFFDAYSEYEDKFATSKKVPFLYAEDVLKKIVLIGGKNFIVTEKREFTTLELLGWFDYLQYFEEIITNSHDFLRKPDPGAFLHLIDKYELNKDETITIGDRALDIEAGIRSGIHTCLFSEEDICPAEMKIASLGEILHIIG